MPVQPSLHIPGRLVPGPPSDTKIYRSSNLYIRGDPPQNMELSSGWWVSCSTGFPCSVNVLGTHLYQCTSWHCCERLCSTSANFFWRLFQHICPFHDGWFTSAPAHIALNVQQFWTKNSMTSIPLPPYSQISSQVTFSCFPEWKKPSKGIVLLMWKRWNKK